MGTESHGESDTFRGPDLVTARLGVLAASFEDVQKTRKAAQQREQAGLAESLKKIEAQLSRELKKTLKDHVVWPFLEPLKGLSGPLTARLIGAIGDPHTFPGQRCTEGHYLRPIYAVGTPCPVAATRSEDEGVLGCEGTMLPPRTTTGVRSIWHWAGLHVVDGKLPQRRKGQRCDWNPKVRTLALGPDGLADQIIKHQTSPYVGRYYDVKERLAARVDGKVASEVLNGPSALSVEAKSIPTLGAMVGLASSPAVLEGVRPEHDVESGIAHGSQSEDAESTSAIESGNSLLRPFQVHQRARTVAVKAFLGDLLIAWKKADPLTRIDRAA